MQPPWLIIKLPWIMLNKKYADILGIEQEGYFNLSQELQDYLTGLSEMRTAQLEEEDRYQKALEEYRHGQYKNTDESLDALSAVEQEHKENLARIQDEYLANFNEDTLEQSRRLAAKDYRY